LGGKSQTDQNVIETTTAVVKQRKLSSSERGGLETKRKKKFGRVATKNLRNGENSAK